MYITTMITKQINYLYDILFIIKQYFDYFNQENCVILTESIQNTIIKMTCSNTRTEVTNNTKDYLILFTYLPCDKIIEVYLVSYLLLEILS